MKFAEAVIAQSGFENIFPFQHLIHQVRSTKMTKVKKVHTESEPADSEHKGSPVVINVKHMAEIGDKLAKREKYEQVSGLEAVHYYLMQKHHWAPKRVRSMKLDELWFCLREEKL
jgi:hypothetical protein